MDFNQLKIELFKENEIERIQRLEGYNVNDRQLPYDEVAIPRMPEEVFSSREIFLLINIIVILQCPLTNILLWN